MQCITNISVYNFTSARILYTCSFTVYLFLLKHPKMDASCIPKLYDMCQHPELDILPFKINLLPNATLTYNNVVHSLTLT